MRGLIRTPRAARNAALNIVCRVLTRPLYRLCLGRWPNPIERRRFSDGLLDRGAGGPALLRALNAEPEGRAQIARLAASNWTAALSGADAGVHGAIAGNPFAFWRGAAIAFLHIEKTAGTALVTALSKHCHPMQIFVDPLLGETQRLGVAATPFAHDLADRKLIWGHYDLPGLLRLAPGRPVITMLREPRARILSLYYFWRSIPLAHATKIGDPRVSLAQQLGLLDFLRSDQPAVHDSVDNAYVRRLASLNAGGTLEDKVAADPEGSLALALAALEDLAFVGIVERMPETLAGLSRVLGLDLGECLPVVNSGSAAVAREAVTPEITAALGDLTRLDQVIYENCCRRLDESRVDRAGPAGAPVMN